MYNCHDDILAYHNEEVTLSNAEQDEMRARRDTNRQRLKDGLERDGETSPSEFQSQGSYAHHTMVQQPDKNYDIDDGVYFWKDDLEGPNGGDKTALDAKKMVQKALHDAWFKKSPEVRTNCVRVYYDIGYHLDVPVYRKVKTTNWRGEEEIYFELASSDWKESDPAEVTRWFQRENESQSPDTTNGRQLRRQTRLNKAFARSRDLDVPVYRKVKTTNWRGEEEIYFELASSDWKESDPAEVTRWFQRENESQSPDTTIWMVGNCADKRG